MQSLRTPDKCFMGLPGFSFTPNYLEDLPGLEDVRVHYLDEGSDDADVEISGCDRRVCVRLHHLPRIIFGEYIPGAFPRIITGGACTLVRSHRTAVFPPHVYRVDIGVCDAIIIKNIDYFLFTFLDIVLEGFFVGVEEVGESAVITRADCFVCRQGIDVVFHLGKKGIQGEVNMLKFIRYVCLDRP